MADMTLKIRVEGVESVQTNLDLTKADVRSELSRAVMTAATAAVASAKGDMSGRPYSTGRTAGAIRAYPIEGEGFMTANVGAGPEGFRGKFWERGFKGSQDVKAHLREIKTGRRMQVMKVTKSGKLKGVKTYQTGAAEVKAYHRETDGAARQWLAPAVNSVRDSFRQAVMAIADKKREV